MTLAPAVRARRAVSNPIPELPPMTKIVWPRSSRSRWVVDASAGAPVMDPPDRKVEIAASACGVRGVIRYTLNVDF
jgi:hypothetical protein